MNRLIALLTAIVAVVLMAGTSFAGGIDHGSWGEFTGLTSGTVYTGTTGTTVMDRNGMNRGPEKVVTLNYETGQIHYGTIGQTIGTRGAIEEHYGVAPAWNEHEGAIGTIPKDYEENAEINMFLN